MAELPGAKAIDNINGTKLIESLLDIIPNVWSKQSCVQVFYCETIHFEKKKFEFMKIAKTIYEGVVEPSLKQNTRADSNRDSHREQIRGEAAFRKNYFGMGKRVVKRKQRYVYHTRD